MSDKSTYKLRSNIVGTLLGAGFILLGILFLIGRYVSVRFDFDFGHFTWPLFMVSFAVGSQVGIILAIVDGMVAMAGAILFFQNTFDLFASWAYAWSLVTPTSIGLAMLVYGGVRGQGNQVKSGLRLTGIGFPIFIFGAVFFELGIGISGFHFREAWLCWPGLLIGLGAVLLLYSLLPRQNHHSGNREGKSRGD